MRSSGKVSDRESTWSSTSPTTTGGPEKSATVASKNAEGKWSPSATRSRRCLIHGSQRLRAGIRIKRSSVTLITILRLNAIGTNVPFAQSG